MQNMYGVFFVLSIGSMFACLYGWIEWLWNVLKNSRSEKVLLMICVCASFFFTWYANGLWTDTIHFQSLSHCFCMLFVLYSRSIEFPNFIRCHSLLSIQFEVLGTAIIYLIIIFFQWSTNLDILQRRTYGRSSVYRQVSGKHQRSTSSEKCIDGLEKFWHFVSFEWQWGWHGLK